MLTPKEAGFSMPPEWYPHAGCWMAWPCHQATWEKMGMQQAKMAYADVAKAIARFEPLTLLVNPKDQDEAMSLCGSSLRYTPLLLDDSWTRDTGPTFLLNGENQLAGIDWQHNAWGGNYPHHAHDDKMARAIIEEAQAQYFQAPLVMEGGAFHVDGEGTVLTTKECLLNANRNPHLSQADIDHYLHAYLGTNKTIWLNKGLFGDETDGHIDEIACFIAPGKVLCLVTSDKDDINYWPLQENVDTLKSARDAKGRPFEIITVEQPPATFLNGERLTLSYINFYRANHGIVMPSFGHPQYDEKAYQLFRSLFNDTDIIQLDALAIFAGGGGIHCITQQQPRSQGQVNTSHF